MKIYPQFLLALCASQAAAFSVPSPRKPSFALRATPEVNVNTDAVETDEPNFLPTSSPAADWSMPGSIRCEGQTRKTFQFGDFNQEVVQVKLTTEGRPMKADIELWIGPDWTPLMINCYSEDGELRPVQTLVGTRNKAANIEVRNTGPYELPLNAAAQYAKPPLSNTREMVAETTEGRYVEGGSIYSVPMDPEAEKVEVLLRTDARQLNAMIELLNGPNNVKQGFKVFTNNGVLNSLYVIFNTPGGGNTVRVKNLAPVEFPCRAYISELK